VESDPRVVSVLRSNVEKLGASSRTSIRPTGVDVVIEEAMQGMSGPWDVVLADPPYAGDDAVRLVAAFDRAPFGSILCVEHAPGVHFSREPDWSRRYGETALSMFHDPAEGAAHG
jgi:16S rRNA G966 N2-methylase RsmD